LSSLGEGFQGVGEFVGGLVALELDLDYLKKVRNELPLLKHLRRDIYKLSKL
jgi:predicted amidohydrolase